MSDASGTASSRALTEEFFALEEDDITDAAFGEVISRTGSHDTAANDDDFCA